MKKIFYITILLGAAFFVSCKKDKKDDTGNGSSKNGTTLDLVKDSVFLYAKEAYYWNNQLPGYADFNPRAIGGTTDLLALTNEVDKISQYAINPLTGKSYEYYAPFPGEAKYSFIDQGEVATELGGISGDFGFAPFYPLTNGDATDLRVKYVYAGSPADSAGIKRGYKITAINGNTNIAYDGDNGTNTQFVIDAYANSKSITLTLQKPDLTTMTATLNTAVYTTNPVLTYKTFDEGNGHIVGYIVFNTFTSDANADPKLDAAFNYFVTQGVTDLVVDLRYNGGGYVSTAEYIDNWIAPAAKNGSVMYSSYFNSTLTNNQAVLLANQIAGRDPATNQLYNYAQVDYSVAGNTVKFDKSKKGNLNVSRVFFIVTGSTASASELTINNLRPVVNVQLIGSTTYGKPVGFFALDINKYQLYIPEFETKNSAGQGGYYDGMQPGSTDYPGVADNEDVKNDFGDPNEILLAHALNYVKKGTYNLSKTQTQGLNNQAITFSAKNVNATARQLDVHKFSGMIFNKKLKLRKKN